MRPVRLEMEGFGAFRDPTVVDFDGVELFALSGPTGAGKSTVIDAICFALYGSVPRYEDRRVVAPAISQGLAELRVRLDFTVEGVEYRAVRVVRRTKQGATTKEARLESGDQVLAGTADELTTAVTALLGLAFEHFTKCVVLPQGAFARFLHDKPGDRQELLTHLLDLGMYSEVAQRARQCQRDRQRDGEALGTRVAELAGATHERRAELAERVQALTALAEHLAPNLLRRGELVTAGQQAAEAASAARARADRLAQVAVPAGVAEIASALARAGDALTAAEAAELEASRAVADAEAAASGDRVALERVAQLHLDRTRAYRTAEERTAEAHAAEHAAGEASQRAASDAAAVERAESAYADAQASNRAHVLREHLVAGQSCPVCEQTVATIPALDTPADMTAAQTERRRAQEAAAASAAVAQQAAAAALAAAARATDARRAVELIDTELAAAPSAEQVAESLAALSAAATALDHARAHDRAARQVRQQASASLNDARQREVEARRSISTIHGELAALGAPVPHGDDLAADWAALASWAQSVAPEHQRAADEATAEVERRRAEVRALDDDVATRCRALGVEPSTLERERSRAEQAVARIDDDLATAERLRSEQAAAVEQAAVAGELAKHLDARHFEKWLLDDVLGDLVEVAGGTLRELSGGQFSLAFDGDFSVIDHRNADQARPARTLSGGETFMASLALALALAERLSMGGAGRLEALFLDEGFGTLDPDSLDVVASAIEELGASGRMVGLISHVPELAERVPVRFEVRRHGNASVIERV